MWIEKEALAGVFQNVCNELDVNYFSCRGYVSQSEMWRAAMRIRRYETGRTGSSLGPVNRRQRVRILHFGDHDPSGIDMTRDIQERLDLFGATCRVKRIALNMDQIEEYEPPPNPAKLSDARAKQYVREHGYESWELDALEPKLLTQLVRDEVLELRDEDLWNARKDEEQQARNCFQRISEHWEEVEEFLDENWL